MTAGHPETPDPLEALRLKAEEAARREHPPYHTVTIGVRPSTVLALVARCDALEAERQRLSDALVQIRDHMAGQCPAWELEWDRVDWAHEEAFTVEEVRDAARRMDEPIVAIVAAALGSGSEPEATK